MNRADIKEKVAQIVANLNSIKIPETQTNEVTMSYEQNEEGIESRVIITNNSVIEENSGLPTASGESDDDYDQEIVNNILQLGNFQAESSESEKMFVADEPKVKLIADDRPEENDIADVKSS